MANILQEAYNADVGLYDTVEGTNTAPEIPDFQQTLADKKRVNLSEAAAIKRKKLDPRYKPSDSFAYEYSGVANKLKDFANVFLSSDNQYTKTELDSEGRLWSLDNDGNKHQQLQTYIQTDGDGQEHYKGVRGNDGDTIMGTDGIDNRLWGFDTAESVFMDDGKYQRIKAMGIRDKEQELVGLKGKDLTMKYLKEHPNTMGTVRGKGYYGRNLTQTDEVALYVIGNGYAVPSAEAPKEYWDAYNKAKKEKIGAWGNAKEARVLEAMEIDGKSHKQNQEFGYEDTFEFIDAAQAGAYSLTGKLIKGIGQGTSSLVDTIMGTNPTGEDGYLEKLGKEMMQNANKEMGYNDISLQRDTFKAGLAIDRVMDAKGPAGTLAALMEVGPGAALAVAKAAPQAAAGSLPEMAVFIAGGVPSLAARVAVMGVMNANDVLDEREKNNGGKKASKKELASIMATETLLTAFDAGMFKFIVSGKKLKVLDKNGKSEDFDKLVNKLDKKSKNRLWMGFVGAANKTGAVATDAVLEGGQEVLTEIGRTLEDSYDTEKYKGKSPLEVLEAEKKRLQTSLIQGAAGGMGFGALPTAKAAVRDTREALRDRKDAISAEQAGGTATSEQEAKDFATFGEQDTQTAKEQYNDLADKKQRLYASESQEDVLSVLKELGDVDPTVVDKLTNQGELSSKELRKIVDAHIEGIDRVQQGLVKAGTTSTKIARGANEVLKDAKDARVKGEEGPFSAATAEDYKAKASAIDAEINTLTKEQKNYDVGSDKYQELAAKISDLNEKFNTYNRGGASAEDVKTYRDNDVATAEETVTAHEQQLNDVQKQAEQAAKEIENINNMPEDEKATIIADNTAILDQVTAEKNFLESASDSDILKQYGVNLSGKETGDEVASIVADVRKNIGQQLSDTEAAAKSNITMFDKDFQKGYTDNMNQAVETATANHKAAQEVYNAAKEKASEDPTDVVKTYRTAAEVESAHENLVKDIPKRSSNIVMRMLKSVLVPGKKADTSVKGIKKSMVQRMGKLSTAALTELASSPDNFEAISAA